MREAPGESDRWRQVRRWAGRLGLALALVWLVSVWWEDRERTTATVAIDLGAHAAKVEGLTADVWHGDEVIASVSAVPRDAPALPIQVTVQDTVGEVRVQVSATHAGRVVQWSRRVTLQDGHTVRIAAHELDALPTPAP